jgi:tetratricopeptide (TPR) repeat protein
MDSQAIIDVLTADFGNVTGLVALVFLVLSFCISYQNRNKLVIKIVRMSKDLPDSFKDFNTRVRNKIIRISQIHRQTKEEAGDINIFREVSMPARGEAIDLMKVVEKLIKKELVAPVKLLELIFKWLFRPPKIEVEILLSNSVKEGSQVKGDLKIECHYIPGKGKKKDQVQLAPAERNGVVDEDIDAVAEEVSLKLLMLLSDEVGTKTWEVLKHITDALENWPPTTIKAQEADDRFAESLKNLKLAVEKEEKKDIPCPLVHYNLALIYYYEYSDDNMSEAISHFDVSTRSQNHRFDYLGQIGLARCYCQNYHRLGKQTPNDLSRAREAAAEAVELIKNEKKRLGLKKWTGHLKVDYARAKYCQAFAQHVTEKDDDLDNGLEIYLEILEMYCPSVDDNFLRYPGDLKAVIDALKDKKPEVPAVIYNNMGYILMARGGRFERKNEQSDEYYRHAKEFFKLSLKRDPNYKFARANLGNLERLNGDYDQAINHYKFAIDLDEKYVNGYSERSWVHLESGHSDDAQKDHIKAVCYASESSHKSKVKEYYARAHWRIEKYKKAKELVFEAIEYDKNNENYELQGWVKSEKKLLNYLKQERVEWQLLS